MTNEELYALLDYLVRNLSDYDIVDEYRVREILAQQNFKIYKNMRVNSGASKCCISFRNANFVIKWSRGREAYLEHEYYKRAEAKGIAFLFPKTEHFATIQGVYFIKQERVDGSVEDVPYNTELKYERLNKTVREDVFQKMQKAFNKASMIHGEWSHYSRSLNKIWAKRVCLLYGRKVCQELCNFVIANKINDLHESNIGYINHRPVILDFCGYWEDTLYSYRNHS